MQTAPPDSPDPSIEASAKMEATAEAERERIVADDAHRTWHGVQLQPWSEERQCLLDALCAADVPLPDINACTDISFYHGMFPWAVKALYLAHHEPSDWERLRPRLLSVISQWGFADRDPALSPSAPVQNVPAETLEDKAAAVNFVWTMVNAHQQVMALRRVKRMGASSDAGNALSP